MKGFWFRVQDKAAGATAAAAASEEDEAKTGRDFLAGIKNFNDFEDFISHLTPELKRIAVPIPDENELITYVALLLIRAAVSEHIIRSSNIDPRPTYDG